MILVNIIFLSFISGCLIGAGSYTVYFNFFLNTEDHLNEMKPMDMGPIKIEEMER